MHSTTTVAERLKTNRSTVTELARIGAIKADRIGQTWVFSEASIQKFEKAVGLQAKKQSA